MPTAKSAQSRPKLQFVQILRGLAAITVVIYHAGINHIRYLNATPLFNDFDRYGWLGVEFFFVLSGFIITYSHFKDLQERKNINLFLRKRFVRIYPIYWVIALVMFFYYLLLKKDNSGTTVKLENTRDYVFILKCFLLFPLKTGRPFINVAWTLSYEIWFYLVFAVCIRYGLQKARWVLLVWALLILFKYYSGMLNYPLFNFILNPLILYFHMGCIVAYQLRKYGRTLTWGWYSMMTLLTVVLFFLYTRLSGTPLTEERDNMNYVYLLMVLFSILLWGAASLDKSPKAERFAPGFLLLMGDASYSIYLTHAPVMMVLYKDLNRFVRKGDSLIAIVTQNLFLVFTVAVCVGAGILVHLFIEKPMIAVLKKRYLSPSTLKYVPEM